MSGTGDSLKNESEKTHLSTFIQPNPGEIQRKKRGLITNILLSGNHCWSSIQ